jgi:Ca2+-binding EF-hand superfamily protein
MVMTFFIDGARRAFSLKRLVRAGALGFALAGLGGFAFAQGPGSGYGPGYGPGYGGPMMGPGHGGGMMGSGGGMMGPGGGMMGPGMMGHGMMGHGMMGHGGGPGMGMGPCGGARTALIDTNQDGFISADESAAWHESVFAAFDADDDEVVTREEYLAGRMGPGYGAGPHAAQMAQRKEARFKEMDKDGDGKLTLDEFLAYAAARYKAADKDGDGKVTVWEFRAARRW